jgi:hypothetical protein
MFRNALQSPVIFTMSKANTKGLSMSCTVSAESILIPVESNWVQTLLRVKRCSTHEGSGSEAGASILTELDVILHYSNNIEGVIS